MGSGHFPLLFELFLLIGGLIGLWLTWRPGGPSGPKSMPAHVARRPCWSVPSRPAHKGDMIYYVDAQKYIFVGCVHALEPDAVVLLLPGLNTIGDLKEDYEFQSQPSCLAASDLVKWSDHSPTALFQSQPSCLAASD